jgi:hypothetical protein
VRKLRGAWGMAALTVTAACCEHYTTQHSIIYDSSPADVAKIKDKNASNLGP